MLIQSPRLFGFTHRPASKEAGGDTARTAGWNQQKECPMLCSVRWNSRTGGSWQGGCCCSGTDCQHPNDAQPITLCITLICVCVFFHIKPSLSQLRSSHAFIFLILFSVMLGWGEWLAVWCLAARWVKPQHRASCNAQSSLHHFILSIRFLFDHFHNPSCFESWFV